MKFRTPSKCLLSIEVFELSGDEIGKLREQYKHDRYLRHVLPKFCINKEFGNILESDGYLQFVNEGDYKFTLFNLQTSDPLLQEEISNMGWDQVFKEIDIKPYLKEFRKNGLEELSGRLNSLEYLILELDYIGGGYFDSEYEVDLDLIINGAYVGNDLHYIRL